MNIKAKWILLRLLVVACGSTARSNVVLGKGHYSQLVVIFDHNRNVSQMYDQVENSLNLTFPKTSPAELTSLENYDPEMVKRMIIKDLGPTGTEVKIFLKNKDIRAFVKTFTEPNRLIIDLFDEDYKDEKDPITGLPQNKLTTTSSPGEKSNNLSFNQEKNQTLAQPQDKSNETTNESPSKRRLLQPTPKIFVSEAELELALKGGSEGIGKAWRDYPPYVYRLQTAAYEARQKKKEGPSLTQALNSSEMMADYASRLYNFGQESKALIAYQQVLQKDPSIFEKDALHLWKFAETHLGQGNLTLARGYYETLTQKHPSSTLADFSKLRIVDITAIRHIQQGRIEDLPQLIPTLDSIRIVQNGELLAGIAIRKSYFLPENSDLSKTKTKIPIITKKISSDLSTAYPSIEGSRTAFMAGTLILSDGLGVDKPWRREIATFAEEYFKRFSGPQTEPYRRDLREKLYYRLNTSIQSEIRDGKLADAIDDFQSLPKSMQSIGKNPLTAWYLAEAYRKLGQPEKALPFYESSEKIDDKGISRVKAAFWIALLAGELASDYKNQKIGDEKVSRLLTKSRDADKRMSNYWTVLQPTDKDALSTAYRENFEQTINSRSSIKSPLRIVLSNWTKAYSSEATSISSEGTQKDQLTSNYSPSGSAVILLSDLGRKFGELGMQKEKREAISILRKMKPKDFNDDKVAKEIWSKQLTNLAEDYRQANQYLDAGRLYAQVGEGSENWEKRAETLYKGGLLLFRAGRREEALTAFRQASSDTNNLFYANLAKERLAQIE